MPTFMFQGNYTAESFAAMVKNPEDRSIAVSKLVQSLGGEFVGFWLAFGKKDFYGIASFPDAQSAAAFGIAVAAAGTLVDFETTQLFPPAEAMAAYKKAGAAKYKLPGKGK